MIPCAYCNQAMTKVINPCAVHFKGKGFYSTDK